MRVDVDKAAVHRIVDRQAGPGMGSAARFMADQQKRAAPTPEIAASIGHESGKDMNGFYARAGVMRFAEDPKRWHRWDGSQWIIIPYPGRETTPDPTWRLYEFGTPRTPTRAFLRQALWSNGHRIARMMLGSRP